MARIEEKRKEKLSSVIGTWVVFGILSAVVITAIVLVIMYFVNKDNNGDNSFEEKYPKAELITFEELDEFLDNATQSDIKFQDGNETIYVLVYSSDYETYSRCEELETYVNEVITSEATNFYVINAEDKENSDFAIDSSEFLSKEDLPSKYPYLLVISEGANGIEITENGVISSLGEIKNLLIEISK